MDRSYRTTVTDRLLRSEDFMYKLKDFQRIIEELHSCDKKFFAMLEEVFITDDQKGKTIKSIQHKAARLSSRNKNLLEEVDRKLFAAVRSLNDGVEDMKTQEFTMTYKKRVPGEPLF